MELLTEDTSHIDALKSQIARRRWQEELKGAEFAGIRWHADPEGRLAIMEAMLFADMMAAQGLQFSTKWKGKGGTWSGDLTKTELQQAASAIGQRRAAAFARERELLDLLESDPANFDVAMIGTGWPE